MKKITMIKKLGVKEIEIRASLYQASVDYQRRKAEPASILGAVGKHFKVIIHKDNDVTHNALKASLTLKLDRRMKGGISVGEKRLELVATEILKNIEDQDDFVIITKDGQKISPHEIFVRTKVDIERSGKSVDRDKAWKAVLSFYKTLETSGVLET